MSDSVSTTSLESRESWGRTRKAIQRIQQVNWRDVELSAAWENRPHNTVLPYGQGRSYGDSCLNDGGTLLVTQGLKRFISFDTQAGLLTCEAGVTLVDILRLIVPEGWFLPVSPGTKFVSIGGAIANDVHGKNHHRVGTFGNFITRFELLRSDGQRLICSPSENADWYAATIGGLGLTGLILWAEIQLKKINNPFIEVESIRMSGLDDFFRLTSESDQASEYTVAWVDCLAKGRALGRGIFMRGASASAEIELPKLPKERRLDIPLIAPTPLISPFTVRMFNRVFYRKQLRASVTKVVHYEPFFYPLDSILNWNRLYGRQGFFQYQCVVPFSDSDLAIRRILSMIADSGIASFLAVLKVFGNIPSAGMLSFPKPGVTLALDFPNKGDRLLKLLDSLDEIVRNNDGSVYPAKDARMSAQSFQHYFPRWNEFSAFVDPRFSSSFWRRVTA